MKSLAKLIYQTHATYLPTAFSAQYYGMPNGKIYLVFSRYYNVAFEKSGLEFVFAEHQDYYFDYECETILALNKTQRKTTIFAEHMDTPRSKFNIFSTSRELRSYGEALAFLNCQASKMKSSA